MTDVTPDVTASPSARRRLIRGLLRTSLFAAGTVGLLAVTASNPATGTTPTPSNTAPHTEFQAAAPFYTYSFPRDHGSHDGFRTEWWYYTGHLSTKDGRQFGYQLTFFRRGIVLESVRSNPSRWAIRHLYLAHLALSDHDQSRFRYAEKVSRAGLGKAGAETGRLQVWVDRWVAEAVFPQDHRHHLQASAEDFSIDLTVTAEKAPVVHGEAGISRKGSQPGQASHYYSLTRLATVGTITVNGEQMPVSGTSWMDHEFGSGELGQELVGWDWFSVQLGNRTELMLYQLRRADGTVDLASSGTLIAPDGRPQYLSRTDVQVEILDHWTSPTSGAIYPIRWRISVPSLSLALTLTPRQSDQELVTRRSTQVTYWEGAVQVAGTWHDAPMTGLGYVEMTGYAERYRQRL